MSSETAKLNEEELRRYYESRKGDVSTWAKKPRQLRRKPGEGPTTTFAVRLTPAELRELQTAAEKRDVSLSEFIRSASLGEARLDTSAAKADLMRRYLEAYDAIVAFENKEAGTKKASAVS
jgi:hypothetical protein